MVTTIVYVKVRTENIEDFKKACIKNHLSSTKEAGNLRFDVLQLDEDPSTFALYEAYDSAESAAAHKDTSHYLEWRESVADWMAEPRKGIRYNSVIP